jgi:uracil-DNA glycosylase family 4
LVGEAPGAYEVELGIPFVGRSGRELWTALNPHTTGDVSFHVTNAVLCRPPDNDMKRTRAQARRDGKVDPVIACRRRLHEELVSLRVQNVIALGGTALESLAGHETSIMAQRGFPIEISVLLPGVYWKVLPTVHPAFVLRFSRWRHVFRSDISKAFRYFTSSLKFELPPVVYNPPGEVLELWLRGSKRLTVDVETDGLEPLTCNLRCVGIGREDGHIVVVPFRSVTGRELRAYDSVAGEQVHYALADKTIVGHNLGYYDRMVLERVFDVGLKFTEDTILMHHCTESELPHSLQFLGSVHTDITAWKAERGGLDYETDEELWLYNARDVAVTTSLIEPLMTDLKLKGQEDVYNRVDKPLQRLCVDLHRVGMAINGDALAKHEKNYLARAFAARERLKELTGIPEFNPGSTQQVSKLMYETLKLPFKTSYETETGAKGTAMHIIRDLLVSDERTDTERSILIEVHKYRRAQKFLGTFVGGILGSVNAVGDGRVHADFNAHATVSGRLSGSNPNLQQIPQELRDCFVAGPGHVLVAADMDQIELRMCAALAGAENYVDAFAAGSDPHAVTSDLIYGEAWRSRGQEERDKLRSFAKRFCYANLYGAGDKTVLEVMRAVEDKAGDFPYLKVKLGEVVVNRKTWLSRNPQIEEWWDRVVQEWRVKGYLIDCIQGRKRFFLDGLDRNAMLNFPVQTASAGVVFDATMDLWAARITHHFEGPGTGIVYQGHDQLIVECAESSVDRVKAAMTQAMNRTYAVLPVKFTSTVKVGQSWASLK